MRNFIGGRFVDGGVPFDSINPVDGEIVGRAWEADEHIVDAAVHAARSALNGEWGTLTTKDRCNLLRAVADRIDARKDDFIAAEIADTGKPYTQASMLDIPRGAENFRIFADLAMSRSAESFETPTADGTALNYAVHKPIGVVAVISPWNLPLLLLTWKVAPALAVGNAVIAKPSEETPSSATLLAEVMSEVGMPEGAFNLIHGFGAQSSGEYLTTHSGVNAVTFTGESATGSAILRSVAPTVKPVSFELGGKNAAIIFEDADFDKAVEGTIKSTFTNCGQVCLCSERVYVHASIFDRFVTALKARAESLVIGRPEDPGVQLGPLISHKHREKVLSYFDKARADGATIITGGGIPHFGDARDNGAFVEPTIWTGLAEESCCIREEIFGPVCHIAPFESEDEAVALANNTDYGLAAAIWTENISRGHRIARRMETGIVWINSWYLRDLRTPFGGVKLSGIGREGGLHSLNFYTETTNICVNL